MSERYSREREGGMYVLHARFNGTGVTLAGMESKIENKMEFCAKLRRGRPFSSMDALSFGL